MKNTLIVIIKILILIISFTLGQEYFFELIEFIGINISNLSTLTKDILDTLYYILILILGFLLFKDDILRDFKRYKRNMFPNILMSIVFFMVLTLIIAIANYFGNTIATAFKVNYIGLHNLNLFNESLDIYLILNFIKKVIVIPFIMVITYILGVNQLFSSRNKGILFSGIIASIVTSFSMNGMFIYILINLLPYFVLYFSLAYIYRKNNSNIWFSIKTLALYSLLASILLEKIL